MRTVLPILVLLPCVAPAPGALAQTNLIAGCFPCHRLQSEVEMKSLAELKGLLGGGN
jgi:hypothetical protein